jgi:hypothetical protein
MIDATPLTWPISQRRTDPRKRVDSRFSVSLAESLHDLVAELERLGGAHIVVSTNAPAKPNGLPYADSREPDDPGAAVYFDRRVPIGPNGGYEMRPFVIACDTYRKLRWNIRAIGMTVEALRTIQRHGASSMLEQAFTGFAALPAHGREKPWWEVLGVDEKASEEAIRDAWTELAKIHHPDVGGDVGRMAEINAAFTAAKLERDVEPRERAR